MGSRAQIEIKDTGVFLYTHWGAKTLENDLKQILNTDTARSRYDDPEYLTRIIFSQLVKGEIDSATGYGIGTSQHGDIELLITLNCEDRTVTVTDIYTDKVNHYPTFRDFIVWDKKSTRNDDEEWNYDYPNKELD